MKVSVVIPCYNSEKYIRPCLDSILSQSHSEMELICVDDCSTDSTWVILQEYAQFDSRVRIFKTEQNSGSANYPLDYGVSQVHSSWISLIGHDDYIEKDYLRKLVSRQQITNARIVCGKMVFKFPDESNDYTIPAADFDMGQVLPGKSAVMLTIGGWKIGANGMLIDKAIWQARSKYLSREFCHMNADEFATREVFIKSSLVAFADAHYYYRQHEGSITNNRGRTYEELWTNIALVSLFRENYGTKSFEYKKVLTHFILSLANYTRIYNSYGDSTGKALTIIRKGHSSLSGYAILTSHISWKHKLVTLLPFFLYCKLMRR